MSKKFKELCLLDTMFICDIGINRQKIWIGTINDLFLEGSNINITINVEFSNTKNRWYYTHIHVNNSNNIGCLNDSNTYITTDLNRLKKYLSKSKHDISKILDNIYHYEHIIKS